VNATLHRLHTQAVQRDEDVVAVRLLAKRIAAALGFDAQDQARIATAVSEIARNAVRHGRGGHADFLVSGQTVTNGLVIRIIDQGPGIAQPDDVLSGAGRAPAGPGAAMGLVGARRLMDAVEIHSRPGEGTTVTLRKHLGPRARLPPLSELAPLTQRLAQGPPDPSETEARLQRRELVEALTELQARRDELTRLNAELEDTNRGVVALHAELEGVADQLRKANDLKTRFLANMSHEFRTPLNSVLALSRLLLDHADGPLSPEQERQVTLIRRSAENLIELVNDLLDIAKVEAGKADLRISTFTVADLFGGLRGVLKPLLVADGVDLVFEEAPPDLVLRTDESKLSQILRNLISNALKFTEQGEVRIRTGPGDRPGMVRFQVSDTGIGIAREHHDSIFQEFTQVESRLQAAVKGTGLGLPLSRRLAVLLGGGLWVDSEPGQGSTFHLAIAADVEKGCTEPEGAALTPAPTRVLVIDDDEAFRYVLRQTLQGPGVTITEAAGGAEGLRLARSLVPDLIFLDLRMAAPDGFEVLRRLGDDPATGLLPVVICSSSVLAAEEMKRLARARTILPKGAISRDAVQVLLGAILGQRRGDPE